MSICCAVIEGVGSIAFSFICVTPTCSSFIGISPSSTRVTSAVQEPTGKAFGDILCLLSDACGTELP
tara:strand:- start:242 stop:442 length:201 start_codon:yes stop_codon:yes gene_type:complete